MLVGGWKGREGVGVRKGKKRRNRGRDYHVIWCGGEGGGRRSKQRRGGEGKGLFWRGKKGKMIKETLECERKRSRDREFKGRR